MTDLDDPAVGACIRMGGPLAVFLAAGANVRDVALRRRLLAADREVIPLVGAQMLRRLGRGHGTFHHGGLQGLSQQLHIIAVGWGDDDGDRQPVPFGQDTPFRAALATIRGIGPRRRPPKGALVIAPSMLCQVHSSPARSS